MKVLYEHSSYREYLRELFDSARVSNRKLSIAEYGERLGLGSSTAKMVLSGKRNLTPSHVHSIAKALRLSEAEREYFEALVLRDQARSSDERAYYSRRLKKIARQHSPRNVLVSKQELLTDSLALGVLVYLRDIAKSREPLESMASATVERLAKAFRVSESRIRDALKKLSSVPAPEGSHGETQYVFNPKLHRLQQKDYVKFWLHESAERVDREYDRGNALFNISSISLTEDEYESLKLDLKVLIESYMGLPDGPQAKSVVAQACLGVFPIARERE